MVDKDEEITVQEWCTSSSLVTACGTRGILSFGIWILVSSALVVTLLSLSPSLPLLEASCSWVSVYVYVSCISADQVS